MLQNINYKNINKRKCFSPQLHTLSSYFMKSTGTILYKEGIQILLHAHVIIQKGGIQILIQAHENLIIVMRLGINIIHLFKVSMHLCNSQGHQN